MARALDPDAALVLNEFSLAYSSPKLEALAQAVATMRAAGVPIGGVGLQAHVFPFLPLPGRAAFDASLRALGSLGIPTSTMTYRIALEGSVKGCSPMRSTREASAFSLHAAHTPARSACRSRFRAHPGSPTPAAARAGPPPARGAPADDLLAPAPSPSLR
jgi:hypothetical protein